MWSAGAGLVLAAVLMAEPGASPTADFAYDDEELLRAGETLSSRAMLYGRGRVTPEEPVPIVVFLHGVNEGGPIHRWVGSEGTDLRWMLAALGDANDLKPFVFAAPSQTRNAARGKTLWTGFDLARFVDSVEAAYSGQVKIDRQRVILAGHSGAGCNTEGGLLAAADGTLMPAAVLALDTCLDEEAWRGLGQLPSHVQLRVYAQTKTWGRDVVQFREELAALRQYGGATDDVVEEVDEPGNAPHETIVVTSLKKALPPLLKERGARGKSALRDMIRAAVRPIGWMAAP
jgi:hypothetical protein